MPYRILCCAMIAERVFLSFISAFSDNNLGNCTGIPQHRIYQSVSPFLSRKIPLNQSLLSLSPARATKSHLSRGLLQLYTGKRLERKTFASGSLPVSKQIYILTILILRLLCPSSQQQPENAVIYTATHRKYSSLLCVYAAIAIGCCSQTSQKEQKKNINKKKAFKF